MGCGARWGNGDDSAAAAEGAEYVFLCVGDDPDVLAVTTGADGVLETMGEGAVLVDHTTARRSSPAMSTQRPRAGCRFRRCPDLGRTSRRRERVLTVMCGGDQADFDRVAPVIDAYSRACNLLGGPGSGQLTKMVNQICIAGLVQGLSEGINFAQRAGLDVGGVVDTISKGAAGSWQMENRAQTMADGVFDYGFALDWMRKDLRICFEEAAANGSVLPVTEIVDGYYEQLQELGLGRWDTSTLIHLLRQE